MAKLMYVGGFDAVDVPLPLGGTATVVRGDVLSTSAEHAELLLEQPRNWQPVAEKKSKKVEAEPEAEAPAEAPAEPLNQGEDQS